MKYLQTDARFPAYMQKYGCYFFSLLHLFSAEELTSSKIKGLYNIFTNNGWILHFGEVGIGEWYRCYVKDPVAIATYLSGKHWKLSKRNKWGTTGLDITCVKTQWGSHFLCEKQGKYEAYNPDPRITIEDNKIDSYRHFEGGL